MLQRVRFELDWQQGDEPPTALPPPARYGEWLTHVFDHPDSRNGWFFEPGAQPFLADAAETVALIEYTLRHSGKDLAPFSDAQVDHGLNYMFNASCAHHVLALRCDLLPSAPRLRAIAALASLYRDCLLPRCGQALSHACESGGTPLNYICYMLWDVAPLTDWDLSIDGAAFYACTLGVLRQALALPHRACQESALTGLAKLHRRRPNEVTSLIEQWLAAYDPRYARLRRYAQAAAQGITL